ncbi:hypothetical protein NDU88_008864 [Pleurodeles waltl]|uniref:Secreted protein n=1 Tax=Pleurodeles waltl TaxID=8319 RepID=A0AAV7NAB9_PLEWA|nr:hypothetical protein NDU88_008864 [Pleurodeles waltl]
MRGRPDASVILSNFATWCSFLAPRQPVGSAEARARCNKKSKLNTSPRLILWQLMALTTVRLWLLPSSAYGSYHRPLMTLTTVRLWLLPPSAYGSYHRPLMALTSVRL